MYEADDDNKIKMKGRIEQAIDWLCVHKGENRHMFLTDLDRLRLFKYLIAHIASTDTKTQSELGMHWMNTLANNLLRKADADELLTCMARVLYAGPAMEQWAEGRLLNRNMKIAPRELAREYVMITNQDKRMVGLYVRDMQRIKSRMLTRICRTGSPEKKTDQIPLPLPRFRQTLRQQEKRKLALAAKKKQAEKDKEMWETVMNAHKQEQASE